MDIFETVEKEIGSFNTWPSYILNYLFCKHLNTYRRTVLCALFYGNRVSAYRTFELIRACAPSSNLADRFTIINQFVQWDKSPQARSYERYFNLILNEMRNLNGCRINTFLPDTGVPISVCWQKGFDGLQKHQISTITSVFRKWYA
jgi:hypothetical protein